MEKYVVRNPEIIKDLKARTISLKQSHDVERIKYLNETYHKYVGAPEIILRAKTYEKLLNNKTLYIDDNLFVGSLASKPGAFYLYPEWNVEWLKDLDPESDAGKLLMPEGSESIIDDTLKLWEKQTLKKRVDNRFNKLLKKDVNPYFLYGSSHETNYNPSGGGVLNYEKVIKYGVRAIIDELNERYGNLENNIENENKFRFYEAAIIQLEAIVTLANRYADLAESMALQEVDPDKKRELEIKSKILRHVPEYPARNLREAIQAEWFIHICCEIEQVGCAYSQGYLGQVLEPYYIKDKKAGIIDDADVVYMLEHLFLKQNDINYYYGQSDDKANSGDLGETISLGGYTEDGDDATAQMDYFILEAQIELKMPQPSIALFYHNKLKPAFIRKALQLVAQGVGMPQFMNADVAVTRSLAAYSKYGATVEEARRSAVFGCVSTAIAHKTMFIMEGDLNIAKAVELALNDGKDWKSGFQFGPHTGDPKTFDTFDEFYQAYLTQLLDMISVTREYGKVSNMLTAEFLPVALRSVLVDGCIENGTDLWHGGAKYQLPCYVYCCGIDAANSLIAVKKLVYEDKALSMDSLVTAIHANFEGYEDVLQICLKAPKHGNGDKEATLMLKKVLKDVEKIHKKMGESYLHTDVRPDAFSKSSHNRFGLDTGALPEGRKAGIALTDGSVSAMIGTDKHGPTVLTLNAANAQDVLNYNSAHLNVKLSPNQFDTDAGTSAVATLIKGFMDVGGSHIQFNCVKREELIDAQIHPENHQDLVVRVAGFSAFFTKLHEGIQNEIIARTEHQVS